MKHAREVGIRLRGKRGTHRSVVLLVLVGFLVQGPVVSSAAYRTGVHAGGSAEYVSVSQGSHRSAPKTSQCITGNDPERSLKAQRTGKDVRFSFFRTPTDVEIGIVRYEIVVLHDQDKAKRGDRLLPWGNCSVNDVSIFKSNAYNLSKWTCGSSAKKPCTRWVFNEVKKRVRDEANGVALVGYGASGEVLLRIYAPFSERLEGTFMGRLTSLVCKSGRIGDPLSRSVFLGSKAALSTIGLVTGRQEAGFATFALDHIAISHGMDPATGRVRGTLVFEVERPRGVSKFLSEADKASLESSIQYLIDETGSELGKLVARSGDQTIYRQVAGESTRVLVGVYFTASTARQFVQSLEQWSETAASWDGVCDVWAGR